MDRLWRDTFLLHAESPAYQQAVQTAQQVIQQALRRARKPYIAFSGGKDSTVMTHLVLQQAPDTMVLHWDYGRAFVPAPLHAEIMHIARAIGVQNLRVETSPLYDRLGRQARNVLGRELIGRLIPQLRDEGYDLCFVGLRAEESGKRRRRMRKAEPVGVISECYPLALWRWMDVWAYLVANNLPYLSYYDARAELIGYERVRFTTLFDAEFEDVGAPQLDTLLHWRWRNEV